MSPDRATLDQLRIDRETPTPQGTRAWLVGLGLIVLAGVAIGIWWWGRAPVLAVRTGLVREQMAMSGPRTVLNGSGHVVARREATVSSKITGKVVQVLIEEGMQVGENQEMARLDDANIRANLALAQAQLEAAQAALSETRVRLAEAERESGRMSRLAANNIASAAEMDRASAEANSLKARLERQQVEISVADKQVALWDQQLSDTIIRAPFAGIVTAKNAQPGEMISPISAGTGFTRTGIGTVVDMSSLEIEVDVNESFIDRLEPNQPVEAMMDAYPDWKIPARVIAIVPTADRQKATVKVRVAFEKLDPRMLPQMRVKVAFHNAAGRGEGDGLAGRGPATLIIPTSAVQRQQDGQEIAWVLQGDGVEKRQLRLGASTEDETVVLSGLKAGERVILSPPADLAAGKRVKEIKP